MPSSSRTSEHNPCEFIYVVWNKLARHTVRRGELLAHFIFHLVTERLQFNPVAEDTCKTSTDYFHGLVNGLGNSSNCQALHRQALYEGLPVRMSIDVSPLRRGHGLLLDHFSTSGSKQ